MYNIILGINLVVAVLLCISILIQDKGAGLGDAIAGQTASSFQTSKRGAERVLSQVTIILLVVFIGLSLTLNFV